MEGVAIGVAAALQFAAKVVEHRGRVSDEDVEDLREAGYEDGEIAEVIGHTALNIFSNCFNHVAQTVVDFPEVPVLAAA